MRTIHVVSPCCKHLIVQQLAMHRYITVKHRIEVLLFNYLPSYLLLSRKPKMNSLTFHNAINVPTSKMLTKKG